MLVPIRETITLPLPAAKLFGYITSEEGFASFRGWGPIPGIRAVDVDGSLDAVGAALRVLNTDGSTHREEVREVTAPRRYAVRIHGLDSVFRHLVAYVDETWELEQRGEGTHVTRTFTFALRSVIALPVALPLGHAAFRLAMRRHHRDLAAWAAGGP